MTKKTQINPPLDTPLVQSRVLVQKIHPKTDCRLISLLIPGLGFRRVALRHFWGVVGKTGSRQVRGGGKTSATVSKAKGGNRAGFCSPRVLVAVAKATELDCKLWRISVLSFARFSVTVREAPLKLGEPVEKNFGKTWGFVLTREAVI